ncbi:chemotaxis protein CheD [Desulfofalx alkaliphila]|uniref:chemotaxis protein CheD n=1 Tax=Desulfofalx alkaliphila TaxID=105483 RepID=UPI0004E17169|nr:chemotaxis protein CheD [Desulfofalx alkaliphila]
MEPAKLIKEIQVGIAEYKVSASPNKIITLGLGSCVGVTLYDPRAKVGGLLHIMLPDSTQFKNVTKPTKYADLGIPLMIRDLERKGALKSRLQAKLAGGAQMFSGLDRKFVLNIGQRNAEMTKKILKQLGIRVIAEELGGNRGRTMIIDLNNGQVTIRTIGTPLKVI